MLHPFFLFSPFPQLLAGTVMKNKVSTRRSYSQWLTEGKRPEEAERRPARTAHACLRRALRLLGRSLNPSSQLKALLLLWRGFFQDGCPSCKQARSRSRQWAAGQPGDGCGEGEGTCVLCSSPAASLRFVLETWSRLCGPGLAGRDARPLEPGGRFKPFLPRRSPWPAGLKLPGSGCLWKAPRRPVELTWIGVPLLFCF